MALPITAAEAEQIGTLRAAVRDIWRSEFEDDVYLVRRLRARSHHVGKAEKMLRATVEWRQRENIDTIMDNYEPAEVLKKYHPGGYYGHDKEGSPLFIDPVGGADVKGLSRSASERDLIIYNLSQMERLYREIFPKRSEEEGFRVTQSVSIFDMKSFGLSHASKTALQPIIELAKLCSDHYPETMKVGFIINAPALLPVVWKIVAPFLDEATRNKLHILGSDYQRVLLEHFEPQHLPACYGGTLTDANGDPRCSSYISWGGEIPESYYLKNQKDFMNEVTVNRGHHLKLEYSISTPGSQLSWEFFTEDHDIGFSISLERPSTNSKYPESQVVVKYKRVSCNLIPEKGELDITEPGRYVVQFDNTYSWTRHKRLWYRIESLEAPSPTDEMSTPSSTLTTFISNETNENDS